MGDSPRKQENYKEGIGMNYIQFVLFLIYLFSVAACGAGIYRWFRIPPLVGGNRCRLLGEVLLLGSILFSGEFLLISFAGFYTAPVLWAVTLFNFLFLLQSDSRELFLNLFSLKVRWDMPKVFFLSLLGMFVFRNCFFLVDVDSHSTYLYAQKLWLEQQTSLWGNPGVDVRVFSPHANALPYALGLSLFPRETLFPQLIVAHWTIIVLLLVFGYTSWRFNGYYGLAAVMLVLFNDHIFYSGANRCCIINSAVIAYLFAAAINFWESRRQNNPVHFVLALIFLNQLMANKYQMIYVAIFALGLGCCLQHSLARMVRNILCDMQRLALLASSVSIALLWYVKNLMITGCPTFPVLAGRLGVLNWTMEKEMLFVKIYGGELPVDKFIKYMNYFFIWPGVNASKYIVFILALLPLMLLVVHLWSRHEKEEFVEWNYWLGFSLLATMGICIANFVDPRVYRYAIAVLSFTAVFSFDFVLRQCLRINNKIILATIIILLALPGYPIMTAQGGGYLRPTLQDNVGVISNQLHTGDVIARYFPGNLIVDDQYHGFKEMIDDGGWDTGIAGVTKLSAFLLPTRPQVDPWHTSIVQWGSYGSAESVVGDLKTFGLKWLMTVEEGRIVFRTPEEYAQKVESFDKRPERIFYDYGFPDELTKIRY